MEIFWKPAEKDVAFCTGKRRVLPFMIGIKRKWHSSAQFVAPHEGYAVRYVTSNSVSFSVSKAEN
jgi:hypothetical protein